MRVRLQIVVVAALALCAASMGIAPAAHDATTASVFVAVCPDGSERVALASSPEATFFLVDEVSALDAAILSLPSGCDVVFAQIPPIEEAPPDSRVVVLQDAAVWSRSTRPVLRASDQP